MTETELRVGVVGAGHIGALHLQSADAVDGARVVGLADPDAGRRRRGADLVGCDTYEDHEALLSGADPDAVVVAVPPALHAEVATAGAEAGAHVFVEKPLARTPAEADRILQAAEREGVHVGVDHTLRYQPDVAEVAEAYRAGELGHVPLATVRRVNDGPFGPPPGEELTAGWALDPEAAGGGALLDLGVHLFDVLRWLFGELTVEYARLGRQLALPYEDTATVIVRAETGTTATVQCGFFQWERPPDVNVEFRLDAVTRAESSTAAAPDRVGVHAARSAARNVLSRVTGGEPEYYGPTYYYRAHHRALRAFLDALAAGDPPPVDGRDGRRAVELVHEAYEAADQPATRDPPDGEGLPAAPRAEEGAR